MKKLLKVSALAVALSAGLAGPAYAVFHGQQDYYVAFYDNENHDNQVGYVLRFCDGHVSRGGTPTLYSETTEFGCD